MKGGGGPGAGPVGVKKFLEKFLPLPRISQEGEKFNLVTDASDSIGHDRSHGCIRLPKGMAEHFFDASPEGTPVIVKE